MVKIALHELSIDTRLDQSESVVWFELGLNTLCWELEIGVLTWLISILALAI